MKNLIRTFKTFKTIGTIGNKLVPNNLNNPNNPKSHKKKGFSLVELIIVVVIIALLSGAAYVGIQKVRSQGMNDKVLDDLIAIANAMEQYKRDDSNGNYPFPNVGTDKMNLNCFYADATYAHDCGSAAFRQGMIDNNLLSKRYLQEVPTDPRTGSRYVYGVSTDKQYFQIAGNYEEGSGYIAKTVGNLAKGYKLPSVIRAFNGPNFVVENGSNLPYSPDHMMITGTLRNINIGIAPGDSLTINGSTDGVADGKEVRTNDEIETTGNATVDIYFSDGSVTHLDADTKLEIQEGTKVEENDEDGIITKIRLKLFSGKIWNKVARLAQNSEFNIETTSAIAGVRGTEFGVDGDVNQVLLYAGEICQLNLLATNAPPHDVNVVKTCTGSAVISDIAVDPASEEDPILKDIDSDTVSGTTPNPSLEALMTTQTQHYLNDNMRPHILSVESGIVTIQNINAYYGVEHEIVIDEIGVYSDGDAIIPQPDFTLDPENDNYLINLDSGEDVTFRFEDPDNNRVSGFSEPPLTITSSTALTEADLYGVEVEEEESVIVGPTLEIYEFNSSHPYREVGGDVQLAWSGFITSFDPLAHINILPTTGASIITGGIFFANIPGQYTLTANDGTNTATLNITVCGYAGTGGSECWVLGGVNDNCVDACNTIGGLSCVLDNTTGTWNVDASNSDVCENLVIDGEVNTSYASNARAPFVIGIECTPRDISFEANQTCDLGGAIGPVDIQRICMCE